MNRTLKSWAWAALIGLAVLAALTCAAQRGALEPWPSTWIEIDGTPWSIASLGHEFGPWRSLVAVLGLFAAALLLPLAVLLPLLFLGGVAVAGVLLVLGIVAGVAALVLWPVLVVAGVAWLIWRASRPSPARTAADRPGSRLP